MHKPCKAALLAASLTLCLPYGASAATVARQAGDVLLSKGDGFVPMPSGAELARGSQVMVRPGGLASITYAGNCVVKVGSGVWVVQPTAPCSPGKSEIDFTGRMNDQAPPEGAPEGPPVGDGGGWHGTTLLIGGLVIAAGIGIAAWPINDIHKSNSSRPASP